MSAAAVGSLRRRAYRVRLIGVTRPRATLVNGRRTRTTYDAATRTLTVRTARLATSRAARVQLRC